MSGLIIAADYPDKTKLSHSQAMGVLRLGPDPDWFRPFAERARVAPRTQRPWGYIHVYGEWGEPPVWELVGYHAPEGLRWGLEWLYGTHDWHVLDVDGFLCDHECHGVFWWEPGDPRLLRLPLGVTR